tara:strand:+ start:148 stop:252 length:105 start_codon:yes stop_codon:yes gene_type:complete
MKKTAKGVKLHTAIASGAVKTAKEWKKANPTKTK